MAEQSKFAGALARLNRRPAPPAAKDTRDSGDSEAKHDIAEGLDREEMAARAYAHWVARGCPDGSPELDWLSAAEDLRSAEAGISDNYSINMTTTKKKPTTKTKTRTPKKIVPAGEPSVVAEAQGKAVEIPVIPVPADAVVIREPVLPAAVPLAPAPAPAVPIAAVSDTQRDSAANAIVRREMLLAVGAGLVPIPWLDMAAIAGVQLKMVGELAANYGVPFSESRGKAMIGALLGSVIPGQLTAGLLGAVLKMIPFVGMATVPALASATTFALGKVFAQHFASGGTLLNFNPEAVRRYFQEQFEKGRTTTGILVPSAGVAA